MRLLLSFALASILLVQPSESLADETANGWQRLAPAKLYKFDNLAFGFDPDNSQTMYLVSRGSDKRHGKAPDAGFWKSVDGGKTWGQKSNNAGHATNGSKSLLVSPHDSNIIYAASEYAPHLMVSRDKGETWTGLTESIHHGISIAIDPKDEDRIWVGADDSVHTSPDGGKTWIALTDHGLPVRDIEKHTMATVHGLFTDRDDPRILYAGFYSADSAHEAGVYKSVDRGKSWKASNNGMNVTPVPPKVNFLRNESLFALAQSSSDPKVLYAGTVWSYLYRTDDGAENWKEMHKGGMKSGIPWSVENPQTGKAIQFDSSIRELAIHPSNPNVIVAGTGLSSAIYSTDGGQNWIDLGCSLPTEIDDDGVITVTYPDGTKQSNKKPYPLFGGGDGWASDVRFHPDDPTRVYFSNTYGIFTKKLPE